MANHLVDRIGIQRVDDGDVEVGAAVHRQAVRQRRVGASVHRRACAGHRGEGWAGEAVDHAAGQAAHAVVLAVRDVEGVGAVDGQAGGLQQSLGGGWGWVGRGIAGIRASAHAQTGHRGDIAAGVHLAHAVVLRVGDVEVAKRVEDDVGGNVQGGGRRNTRVLVEAARAGTVTGVARGCIEQRSKLAASAQWSQTDESCKEKNEDRSKRAHRRGVFILEKLQKQSPFRCICTDLSQDRVGRAEIAATPRIFNIIGLA